MPQELRQVIGIALFAVAMVLLWLALRPRKAPVVSSPLFTATRRPLTAKTQPVGFQDGSFERFQQAVSDAKVSPVSLLSDEDDTDDDDDFDENDDDEQVSRPADTYAPPPMPPITNAVLAPATLRGFFLEVVGESFHASIFPDLLRTHRRDPFHVELVAEPDNKFDRNAVKICTLDGATLGHLSRQDAPRYQPTLLAVAERQQRVLCHGRLAGGESDRPNIGIWLDVEPPTVIAKAFGVKYKRVRKA